MFPVHCVEAVVRPFIYGAGSQIPLCHLLTCVKLYVRGDIVCDCFAPYDKSHVFFREQLSGAVMIAMVYRCGDRAFHQCVAYTIELLG